MTMSRRSLAIALAVVLVVIVLQVVCNATGFVETEFVR